MIDLQVVIDRVSSVTGFNVTESKGNEQEMADLSDLPKITVGYGPIRNSIPEKILSLDIYDINADDFYQSFYIKIICKQSDFRSTFRDVYKSLSSWPPNLPGDINTGFCYTNGEPIGINNTTFWFQSEWKIRFPSNTLFT